MSSCLVKLYKLYFFIKRAYKRKQTSYCCQRCGDIALCVTPCFEIFHTVIDYSRPKILYTECTMRVFLVLLLRHVFWQHYCYWAFLYWFMHHSKFSRKPGKRGSGKVLKNLGSNRVKRSRFSFHGRHLRVDLIKWVSNVRPSVHKKFLRFQWHLVCIVGRGRRVMHDGMQT